MAQMKKKIFLRFLKTMVTQNLQPSALYRKKGLSPRAPKEGRSFPECPKCLSLKKIAQEQRSRATV